MNTLSPEAMELLRHMLGMVIVENIRNGRGDDVLPMAWNELAEFSREVSE